MTAGEASALVPAIDRAIAAKIPVITFDSDSPASKRLAFVGTNNYNAGWTAGKAMAEWLGGKGEVGISTFPGPDHLKRRVDGFTDALRELAPNVRIAATVNDEGDVARAESQITAMLQANPGISGIFCAHGNPGPGAAAAVRNLGRQGQIQIMAFDFATPVIELIESGEIKGTVGQNPYLMGYMGMLLAYAARHPTDVPSARPGFGPCPTRSTLVFVFSTARTSPNTNEFRRSSEKGVVMRRATMTAPGVIDITEVPERPLPGPDEVVLRIKRIGVCGSDVHVNHGRHPFTSYPVVQGHEFAGVIEHVGSNVADLSPGMKATATPQVTCGTCPPCRRGDHHICDHLKVQGFQAPGCAQDFFVTRAERIVPLPDSFTFEQGAFVEPVAVGVHATARVRAVRDGNVVVLGAGPIGNLLSQVIKAEGGKVPDYRCQRPPACGRKGMRARRGVECDPRTPARSGSTGVRTLRVRTRLRLRWCSGLYRGGGGEPAEGRDARTRRRIRRAAARQHRPHPGSRADCHRHIDVPTRRLRSSRRSDPLRAGPDRAARNRALPTRALR